MLKRTFRLLAGSIATLVAATLLVGATGTAANAATSCYGGAITVNVSAAYQKTGPYTTTSRCNDINLKITKVTNWRVATVCWYNYGTCSNNGYWFEPGQTGWVVIASDVKDGTKFTIQWSDGFGPTTGSLAF